MLGAIPGSASMRSLNRRGPSSSASTSSIVQRSPTRATAAARGVTGSLIALMVTGRSGSPRSASLGMHHRIMVTCSLQVTSEEAKMGVLQELEEAVGSVATKAGPSVVGIGGGCGHGSGVVIAEGNVLTNAHNVRGDQVTVVFADGRTAT